MIRPFTTLFLLSSLDGKISTGSIDGRDFDTDLPNLPYIDEGLYQYYQLERNTDIWSFNSGRVLDKIGINKYPYTGEQLPVRYTVWDTQYLTPLGVSNLCRKGTEVVVFSSVYKEAIKQCEYTNNNFTYITLSSFDLPLVFGMLYDYFKCGQLTIQTGGSLNSILFKERLIDRLHLVVAPLLVGGVDTPSILTRPSLISNYDLQDLITLELSECNQLSHSYLSLIYDVRYIN